MKPDDLEPRLTRTPLASLPPDWRHDILAAARAARPTPATPRVETPDRPVDLPTLIRGWWRRCESPWTLLAAGWAVVLVLNAAAGRLERSAAPEPVRTAMPVSRVSMLVAARNYRAEVLALASHEDFAGPESPVVNPAPTRSELRPRSQWSPGRRELSRFAEPEPCWS